MYHAAENGFLDIALELKNLGQHMFVLGLIFYSKVQIFVTIVNFFITHKFLKQLGNL